MRFERRQLQEQRDLYLRRRRNLEEFERQRDEGIEAIVEAQPLPEPPEPVLNNKMGMVGGRLGKVVSYDYLDDWEMYYFIEFLDEPGARWANYEIVKPVELVNV